MLWDTYKYVRGIGLCRSQDDFSENWLKMSRAYLHVMGERPSIEVMYRLALTLNDRGLHELASRVHENIAQRARTPMRPRQHNCVFSEHAPA